MAEVQNSSNIDAQTQQYAEVIHQQHTWPPLLCSFLQAAWADHTGANKLIQTPQADSGVPEGKEWWIKD